MTLGRRLRAGKGACVSRVDPGKVGPRQLSSPYANSLFVCVSRTPVITLPTSEGWYGGVEDV